MLLDDLLCEFLYDCEIRKLTTKTMKSYKNNCKYFFEYLKEKYQIVDVEKVTSVHLKQFFIWQNKKGCKESYLNGLLKTFRAFFKYIKAEEYISVNPILKVKWAKETKTLIYTFNDEEVKRMISVYNGNSYIDIRNKAIICMLFDTGIRNNELCILLEDAIRENMIVIFGKGRKERQVGKSPYLSKVLMHYLQCKKSYFECKNVKSNNLFLSRTGKPLTVETVERIVKQAGELAEVNNGLRCSPHTCRHYFAQCQLRNGIDVYSLSRLMGHENIKITQRYLDSLNDKDVVIKSITTSPLMNL